MAVTKFIFMKLTGAQRHYVQILYRILSKTDQEIWTVREEIYLRPNLKYGYH